MQHFPGGSGSAGRPNDRLRWAEAWSSGHSDSSDSPARLDSMQLHAVAGVDSLLLLVYAKPGKQLKHVAERGSPRLQSIHVVGFVNCRGVGGLQILKSNRLGFRAFTW